MRSSIFQVLLLLVFISSISLSQGKTLSVGTDQEYTSIYDALVASTSGDTLFLNDTVFSGVNNTNINLTSFIGSRSFFGFTEGVTLDCLGVGRAFYVWDQERDNTTLDGFNRFTFDNIVFHNCSAYNDTIPDAAPAGGAILVYSNFTAIKLVNTTFQYNRADYGGALYVNGNENFTLGLGDWHLSIIDSKFQSNYAEEQGGALYTYIASLKVESSQFIENNATEGGAFYLDVESNFTLVDLSFTRNIAQRAGGVYLVDCVGTGNDLTFEGNRGALSLLRASLSGSRLHFSNNQYNGNGGAVAVAASGFNIRDSTFNSNEAGLFGGAVSASSSAGVSFVNTTFIDNTASLGGAVSVNTAALFVCDQCTIQGNTASKGAAVYLDNNSEARVRNSDITDNVATGDGAVYYCSSSKVITNNNVYAQNTVDGKSQVLYCATDIPLTSCKVEGDSPYNNMCADPKETNKGLAQKYQILIGVIVCFAGIVVLGLLGFVLYKYVLKKRFENRILKDDESEMEN